MVTNFYDNYKTEDNQLILIAKNLNEEAYFTGYKFTITSYNVHEDVNVTCKILDSKEQCTSSYEKTETNGSHKYIYNFKFILYNEQHLIIDFSHKIKKANKEILFKTESVRVPIIAGINYCNYKFTIPSKYKYLGSLEDILTKESETVFTYKGECPKESKTDKIFFTPKESKWTADVTDSLVSTNGFENDISIVFPRYYRGGKNTISHYKITTTEGKVLKEKDMIVNDTYLQAEVPAVNKKKAGIEVYTNFTNTLSKKFDVYFPEKYYQIDDSKIDSDIKALAQTIVNNKTYYPGKPNYYKLGKFVYNHMTYDTSYTGRILTTKQIYKQARGVCEHYTQLYNEMLNSIGIKTIFVSGWAFQDDKTKANKNTTGHAWTAALINNEWMELDSTWGLFQGITSGHVLKAFLNDTVAYIWTENTEPSILELANIEMIPYDDDTTNDEENEPIPIDDNDKKESTNKEEETKTDTTEATNKDTTKSDTENETTDTTKETEKESQNQDTTKTNTENETTKADTTKTNTENTSSRDTTRPNTEYETPNNGNGYQNEKMKTPVLLYLLVKLLLNMTLPERQIK